MYTSNIDNYSSKELETIFEQQINNQANFTPYK